MQPGYLGTRLDFKDRYETPLQNGERGAVWQRLSRRLKPYLLRRLKQEILAELPEKIEQVIEVELSPAQKAAYTQPASRASLQIDELSQNSTGAAPDAGAVCRPPAAQEARAIFGFGATDNSSSKLSAFWSWWKKRSMGAIRAGIRQSTSMLDLIAKALEEAGISFCRLDGSTQIAMRWWTVFKTTDESRSF